MPDSPTRPPRVARDLDLDQLKKREVDVVSRTTIAVLAIAGGMACATTTAPASSPTSPAANVQAGASAAEVTAARPGVVPVGQELDVRLQNALRSDTAKAEDRFQATTVVDLTQDGEVLIPAGSLVEGIVSSAQPAGRVDRVGRLSLAFESITVRGREHRIRGTATRVFESEGLESEAGRIGAGAGVGGIIGGILGGFKGALAGVLIGAGGTIAATEGKDVELRQGTVVRLRFDSPLDVAGPESRRRSGR